MKQGHKQKDNESNNSFDIMHKRVRTAANVESLKSEKK